MSNPVGAVTIPQLTGPDAHRALAALRAASPVAWVPALDAWLVTSHTAALEVLRDATTFTVDHPGFSTARVVGPSMLSTDGPTHARHRRPFGHAFRPAEVTARFGSPATELAHALLAAVRDAGRADLRTVLAGPLATGVVTAALGLGDADASTVLDWYSTIVAAVTDISAGLTPRPDAVAAMAELDAAVRAVSGDDTLLGAARRSLDDAAVTSNAAVLMFGGIETTEAMIANAVLHLLSHREVLAQVQSGRALLPAVVEESLRLEPAAAVVDRYATVDAEVQGAAIHRGDLVRVSLAAANRDPQVFADPDVFDPSRINLGDQLAFARGPHVCLAMDLARLETAIAVEAVLDDLPGVRLDGPAEVDGLVFRKPAALPVAWSV